MDCVCNSVAKSLMKDIITFAAEADLMNVPCSWALASAYEAARDEDLEELATLRDDLYKLVRVPYEPPKTKPPEASRWNWFFTGFMVAVMAFYGFGLVR